jgi:hypothetical protein
LARIVEISPESIESGEQSPREIYARALAWTERNKIMAKLAADAGDVGKPAANDTRSDTATNPAQPANFGAPEPDPQDARYALWVGKRIYLGNDSQVGRLFWLLAKPLGRAASLAQVQRAIDGMETPSDYRPDEVRKTRQRVRQVVSKLRAQLGEAKFDDHVVIVRGGNQAEPEYTMIWRYSN